MRSATASTSRSLWVMNTIDLPWSIEAAHDAEELVDLARREHRGRLVEDQDVGLAEERLQQLDPLLLADREVLDLGVGVDAEPVLLAELADAATGGVEVEHRPAAQLVAEHDVLGDREHRDQLEVLVHHPDAGGDRIRRAAELHRLAVDADLAGVGLVEPEDHVHQRGLARRRSRRAGSAPRRRWRSKSTSSLARRPGKRLVIAAHLEDRVAASRVAAGHGPSSSWRADACRTRGGPAHRRVRGLRAHVIVLA